MAKDYVTVLIRGILLYIILIIGITVIVDWVFSWKRKRGNSSSVSPCEFYVSEDLFDEFFDKLKSEIRQQLVQKLNKGNIHFTPNLQLQSQSQLPQVVPSVVENFVPEVKGEVDPSEKALLEEAARRISGTASNQLDNYSNYCSLPGQVKYTMGERILIPTKDTPVTSGNGVFSPKHAIPYKTFNINSKNLFSPFVPGRLGYF